MGAEHEMALATLEASLTMFLEKVGGITLDEALDSAGGLGSVLGADQAHGGVDAGVPVVRPGRRAQTVHWGEVWPLRQIVAAHWSYHAGKINLILAVRRGEAWEYGEHLEENHISTLGHGVRRPWITDEYAARLEREMRDEGR